MHKKIAELLPKGITEDTVNVLSNILEEEVKNRVNQQTKVLTSKFVAFIKSNINQIQESAIRQLEESNETFRKAKLFEHVTGILALETVSEDYDLPLESLTTENTKLSEAVETLTEELNKTYESNSLLESKLALYTKKINLMEAKNTKLLEENSKEPVPFKSSEKARIISRNKEAPDESDVKKEKLAEAQNDFLNEHVVRLALKKN